MSQVRALEIENEIDSLVLSLLGPLRMSKTIDSAAFSRLYALLDELTLDIKDENWISKRLVRIMFLIFTSMLAEANHCRNPRPILDEAWRVGEYMSRMFEPSRTV